MAVVTYKCPNCDGELLFNPAEQKFKCEYCGSRFGERELEQMNPASAQETSEKTAEGSAAAVVYSCPSCGAEVVTTETTAATFCFFCHNPVVLSGRLEGSFEPDRIIPFVLDRDRAVAEFKGWVRKKRFLPHAFFSESQIEKLTGIYYPYWLTDCTVEANMEADGRNVRTWRSGNTQYTETSHYRASRAGNILFEGLLKSALAKLNRELVESVQPYDQRGMRAFSMTYLSGFLAEKRDIEHKSLEQEIGEEVYGYAQPLLRDTVRGYASVDVREFRARVTQMSPHYALLPVWVLTYHHKGQLYYYAMNGQTGKVTGRLPVSFKRLALLFAGVAVPLAAILLLGGYLL